MTAKKTTRATQTAIRIPEVSAMVERELSERPNFSHRVLQTLAAELDASIGEMDPRLFHAEYVVPAQRLIAEEKGRDRNRRGRKTTRAGAATRSRRRRATGAERSEVATQAVQAVEPAELETEAPPAEAEPVRGAEAEAAAKAIAAATEDAESATEVTVEPGASVASPERPRRRRVREPVRESPAASSRTRARAPRSRERVQAVRTAFFDWARALADADSPASIVEAFDQVDRYVDAALEA